VAVITSALVAQRRWLALLGGATLVALGLRTMFAKPVNREVGSAPAGAGLAADYVTTLGLTLTNPATILGFTAVFAGLALGTTGSAAAAALLVLGVWLGSAAWWVVLASVVALFRTRVTPMVVRGIRVGSGLAILAFGAAAIISAVSGYR
jgi:threonine/homoserine/homoserine lactone efflux protein